MSRDEAAGPYSAVIRCLRVWRPPVHDVRFWVVQAGVLALAVLHDVILVGPGAQDVVGVPAPITSGLLLIPVLYAAFNFGVRGAVGTSLWATALIVPHWFLGTPLNGTHFWIEAGYLLVLNVVALVVGKRVESEQRARRRSEAALRAAEDAQARYYSLFEDQAAPVIITDSAGFIVEVNFAGTRLLGARATGRRLDELVGVTAADLVDGAATSLTLDNGDGQRLLFAPTAHRLTTADGTELVQVVLTDVTEPHRRQEEQRIFAGQLLQVQEDERRRLARELHDDPLQTLTYLTRILDDLSQHPSPPDQLVERLEHGKAVVAEATTALRKLIHGLRPPVLDDLGIVSALRQLVQEVERRTDLSIDLRVAGPEVRLPPEVELAAYRIAQESLNNAIRHADASRVKVKVSFDSTLTLTVADDGRGISRTRQSTPEPGAGLGLIGMRERVSMAGGSLSVTSRSGHGTRVQAKFPLTPVELRAQGASGNLSKR